MRLLGDFQTLCGSENLSIYNFDSSAVAAKIRHAIFSNPFLYRIFLVQEKSFWFLVTPCNSSLSKQSIRGSFLYPAILDEKNQKRKKYTSCNLHTMQKSGYFLCFLHNMLTLKKIRILYNSKLKMKYF